MALTGGTPRAFLVEGANTPAWSPDDSSVVYVYKPNRDDPMLIADRTGADARQILAPAYSKNINPVWSPDGQWIYFVRGSEPQDETNDGRVAPSILGRHAGAADPAARGREFPGAARRAHAALRGARGGPVRAVAVGARRRPQGDTPGAVGRRSIHVGVGQPRRAARGRHRRQPQREPVARAAARSARRRARRATLPAAGADRSGAGAALRRQRRCFICPPAGRATASGRSRTDRRRKFGARRTARCPNRPLCRRTAAAWSSSSDTRGNGICRSCRRTARTRSRSRRPSKSKERPARATADWSPDGTWIVTGGRDAQGPALFKIPVKEAVRPVRLVAGQAVNPIWSPNGKLIVYAGRSVVGQVAILGVRPDGTPSSCRRYWSARRLSLPARRIGLGVLAAHSGAGLLAARFRHEDNPVSSLASAIRAPSGRSTSHLTGNTSCSTARGRTRISS